MPQAIIYCDRCGSIIPPAEQARGEAIVGDVEGICASCAGTLSPEQRKPSLRIWTDRPKVRAWIDDVEVRKVME